MTPAAAGVEAQCRGAAQTQALAYDLAPLLEAGDVLVLSGGLGAGKTTFVQGLARGLGITEPVTSPSFTLVRRYEGRLVLVHADLYRLERVHEVLDLGIDELAGDDGVVAVEWGEVARPHLPSGRHGIGDHLEVRLEPGEDPEDPDERRVALVARGPSWRARQGRLADLATGRGA